MSAAEQLIPYSQFDQLREAREILKLESEALVDVARRLDAGFCAAVELLLHCSGSVIVCGMGKAGLIGQKLAATLSSTGTRAHFLHPAEAVHGVPRREMTHETFGLRGRSRLLGSSRQ